MTNADVVVILVAEIQTFYKNIFYFWNFPASESEAAWSRGGGTGRGKQEPGDKYFLLKRFKIGIVDDPNISGD